MVEHKVQGTAFLVDSTWYVRYLHGGGVLVPLDASAEVKSSLIEGALYEFSGRLLQDHRGCVTGVASRQAVRLGGN